jgi:hypothetical protein
MEAMTPIRFKRIWRQYFPGDVCDTFEYGFAATLVARGTAEFVTDDETAGMTPAPPAFSEVVPNKAMKKKQVHRKQTVG